MPSILSWASLPTKMSSPPSPIISSKPPPPVKMSLPITSSLSNGEALSPGAPSWVPFSIQSSPSPPVAGRLVLAPRMKSSPWPPKEMEMSSVVMMKSWPSPPRIRLPPASMLPATITSLPSLPSRRLSPNESLMMSSPAPPSTASLPAPPSRRSLPASP
ncbi:hypothetical protein D3C84_718570 [compost metagenome]